MGRRKLEDKNTRKLQRLGKSIGMTLPISIIRALKWRKGQKVTVRRSGTKIIIQDWEK